MAGLPLAMTPKHPDMLADNEFINGVETITLNQVIESLTKKPAVRKSTSESEPSDTDIVFKGTFEQVNEYFYMKKWQEGIPIAPPTRDKIEKFFAFTNKSPDEVMGTLMPENREATIRNIAVNGVMAGCRPEYMPVLIALVEVMLDPKYGVEHSGNTPGAEALILINGPIIKELMFNYTQGALRVGFQANTSIGRFWRLYLRNVVGFLPHETDKGTFGNTWRVVLAENEDVLSRINWKPTSFYEGFKENDNVVTVARYTGGGVLSSVFGNTAEEVLPYLADGLTRYMGWEFIFTVGALGVPGYACTQRPHLILSPCIAEVIANSGYSKTDVKKYLYKHARLPAWKVESIGRWRNLKESLADLVKAGIAPKAFCESKDENRLVPITCSPDDFLITVSGDPLRNNAYALVSNGKLGYTTSKKIELPKNWPTLLSAIKASGQAD